MRASIQSQSLASQRPQAFTRQRTSPLIPRPQTLFPCTVRPHQPSSRFLLRPQSSVSASAGPPHEEPSSSPQSKDPAAKTPDAKDATIAKDEMPCKIHWKNTATQLQLVGPKSLGVALLTAGFVGMVFTIQFVREFAKLGLTRSVGGVLGLALSRELTPVITSIILAGRVSEQFDSLRVLYTDPVDYLVTPRVVAGMIASPILNVLCFMMGIGASVGIAELVYDVPANVILDSVRRALTQYDLMTSIVKSWVFGTLVSVISCSWGFTTTGGAKGVGESTTSAVVISLVTIFVADFILSFIFFQGQGSALKQLK
eukprot:gene16015-22152_t